ISSIRNHRLAVRGVRNAFSRKRTPSLALPTLGVEALKPFAIIHASRVIEIAHAPASTSASHREKRRGKPVWSGCSGATLAARNRIYSIRLATNTARPDAFNPTPASCRIAHNDARDDMPCGFFCGSCACVERDSSRLQQSRHLDSGPLPTALRWNAAFL